MTQKHSSLWILIRHGESTANAQQILSGWQDVLLTKKGEQQAQALQAELQHLLLKQEQLLNRPPELTALSSDLQRAVRTAQLALGSDVQLLQKPQFRERYFGAHQGRDKATLRAEGTMQQFLSWFNPPPHTESFQQLAERVFPAMDEHNEELVFLFAHGGVIRMIVGLAEGLSLEETARMDIPNTTPYQLQAPAKGWSSLIPQPEENNKDRVPLWQIR
jgi:2,3-bisphosphoglycerate-dependent phosphoglycerate mutase